MSNEIAPETVERMVALVRGLSDPQIDARYNLGVSDARAIAALLPEPVDPDLVEARQIAADAIFPTPAPNGATEDQVRLRNAILAGKRDNEPAAVGAILKAIKRGRELAKAENSHAA